MVRRILGWKFRLKKVDSVLSSLSFLRRLNNSAGLIVASSTLILVATGVFHKPGEHLVSQVFALTALSLLILVRLFERAKLPRSARLAPLADIELGSLFIGGAYACVDLGGGATGLVYPIVYAIVAFLATFYSRWQNLYFLVLIAVAELALLGGRWEQLVGAAVEVKLFVSHLSFIGLFAF